MSREEKDPPSPDEGFASTGTLDSGALSRVVARLQTLPSYHPTVVALLGISTEGDAAVDKFDAVFQTDPGFASELLGVANSPEFGFPGRISSIRHALTLLGLERVSALAFSLSMQFYMAKLPRMSEVQGIWSHSIATAIVAEAIAEAAALRCAGIYTAGLVHDLGRLGLLMTEGQKYVTLSAQGFPTIPECLSKEAAVLGVTHPEAGILMAEKWGFPQDLCDCIRWHHDAFETPLAGTLAVVSRACRLAAALGYAAVRYHQAETSEGILAGFPAEMRGRECLQPNRLQQAIAKALRSVGP